MTSSDILLVSDAWFPQINGVVCTLDTVRAELEKMGRHVATITPNQFRTLPCPTYPDIRLSVDAPWRLTRMMEALNPRYIHIATEGPLGFLARRYCMKRNMPFTTSFHTKFAEYMEQRLRIPARLTYRALRNFHAPAHAMLVATPSMIGELEQHGFTNATLWSRGVDLTLFHPTPAAPLAGQAPHWLYVGRVSTEKNLPAFLALDLPGTKHVVGDGPMLEALRARFPNTHFAGALRGDDLRRYYAMSDVFVFASKSDTFGLVMLEALACGTPVAAYPVTGPKDVILDATAGILHDDLKEACLRALHLKPDDCVRYAAHFTWEKTAQRLADVLVPIYN